MGNTQSVKKVNFEDVQYVIKNKNKYLLINTLISNEQNCLIKNTVSCHDEVSIINQHLNNKQIYIIIYGRNSCDDSVRKKYVQLMELGFHNIFIYPGGIFEWLMLQDIYGDEDDAFPTTVKDMDILRYKGCSELNKLLLTNID